MVFQSFELFPHLTALDNVTLALRRVSKWDRRRAEEVGRALLERVGLEDKVGSYPSQLSGGQQQRVAIARALATSPDLMLFDEPTSALDAEMVGEVLAVIKELVQEGMTMIVVTHELRFASEAADRLVVFSEGVVVEEGNPSDVLTAPKSEPTRALVRHLLAE
jgi:polar amino acid transport system ATP-binding protein